MRTRKRSAYVGFSVVALSAAALSGCGPQRAADARDVQIYKSVDECAREKPRSECDAAFAQAKAQQAAAAPNFQDRAACEQDWGSGRCDERRASGGGSVFIPAMAGFMLGQAMAGRQGYGAGPAGCGPADPHCGSTGGSAGAGARPVFAGRRGLFAGGDRIGEAQARGGGYEAPRSATVRPAAGGRLSAGVTRGGFGRMAGLHLGGRGG